MRDNLKENGAKVFMCASLSEGHWDERPASFHVEVDYTSKDIIMQHSFWNKGLKVRNWSIPKKGKSSVWYKVDRVYTLSTLVW